nr:MAG TPA: hypothetical protein [Bacteriophage sp.]DAQ90238.1 MAG TPA: hypothetical protein [Bacteriophage sp.]
MIFEPRGDDNVENKYNKAAHIQKSEGGLSIR